MNKFVSSSKARKGFTLVELAVVIVIIGVLAAFGVPRFIKSVERSKAAEAFAYLAAVRDAQERYHAQNGIYSNDLTIIDIKAGTPKYVTVGTIAAASTSDPDAGTGAGDPLERTWSLTLTRSGASAGYGAYTVTFTEQGFDTTNSTIAGMPDINPMSGSSSSNSSSGSGS